MIIRINQVKKKKNLKNDLFSDHFLTILINNNGEKIFTVVQDITFINNKRNTSKHIRHEISNTS